MKIYYKKVHELIKDNVLEPPMDGNHGEKHPKTSDYVNTGIPFVLVPDLKDGIVDLDNCYFISSEQAKTLRKGFSKTGDVLFTHKATIGKVAMVDTKDYEYIILTPQVTYYRIKNTGVLDNRYLYYYFLSDAFQKTFRAFSSSGGTRDYLGIIAQCKLPIIYPEIDVQRNIANILSKYDGLIQNNNKRIKILEQMAENLYKEWFVRFRFPGHETTEFENGLPKGWKTKRFIEEFNITYGKGLPTEELLPKGYPVFGSNGLIGYYSKYMYKKPQVLISCRGASSGVVNISLPYSFITSNSLICEIDDRTETNFEYLSFALGDYKLVQYQTGSAQPQITIDNIKKLKIIIPSNEVLNDFKRFIGVINEKVLLLKNQNQNLIKQRDMLLPRLMSGKLEVGEKQEKVLEFKPKKTFIEFKNEFKAAARKDGGLTEQDLEELYKAYCDDSLDE